MMSNGFEYRENFKKSLRTYERPSTRYGLPRPMYSAIFGVRPNTSVKMSNKFSRTL
jgi:hypothetical protein